MKPIIGVSAVWSNESMREANFKEDFFYVASPYINAIYCLGGIPLLLTPNVTGFFEEDRCSEILKRLDGLLLTGGGDLGLGISKNYKPLLIEQQKQRYKFETCLIKTAWERDMPVMGICRGHQMMAEVLGGIIKEKPVEGHGKRNNGMERKHNIILKDGSLFSQICGVKHWMVNSYHCQVVEKLPNCLQASGLCEDGVIEVLEAKDKRMFIGVQFHPELMMASDEIAVKLFKVFIDTSAAFAQ